MARRSSSRGAGKKKGMALQLPAHVQNTLNKEERLLQQSLDQLERETKHLLKCISQDQQVAGRKLRIMEKRLIQSQARSQSAMSNQRGRSAMAANRKDACSTDYFRSLLTPASRDGFSVLLSEESASSKPKSAMKKKRVQSTQSALDSDRKKSGESTKGGTDTQPLLRKTVSFNIKQTRK